MTNNEKELEAKIAEFDGLPGHVLGLTGWILRTLPKEKRQRFLEGYEKLIRIAYHPDHANDQKSMNSNVAFIQRVSQAISFLCNSELNYEMASEIVPSPQNPIIKLKTSMEEQKMSYEKESSELKANLASVLKEKEKEKNLNSLLTRKGSVVEKRIEILENLNKNNIQYASEHKDYSSEERPPYTIIGHFLNLQNSKTIEAQERLYSIIFNAYSSFNTKQKKLAELIKEEFRASETQEVIFKEKTTKHKGHSYKILGSITTQSLRAFFDYAKLNQYESLESISKKEFGNFIPVINKEKCIQYNAGARLIEKDLSSFAIPSFGLDLPIILKDKSNIGETQYTLFKAEQISFGPGSS